ncbi:MAG: DNA polymerase III subunit delta' [Clostridia bacterium]
MSGHPWNEPVFESVRGRLASLPHALLLHGPRGVGKLALAERLAQLLLCEAAEKEKPCGRCEGCRWLAAGNHPDFRRLEPEALAAATAAETEEGAEDSSAAAPARKGKPSLEIKIEQVRQLAAFLNVGSHRGGRRVALVHPAEDMNANAANALLKSLEEPPPGAMFLLVSHRPARLLPTIRSRCVAIPVPLPPRDVAAKWLAAQKLRDADRWLAYAGGAPLRALEYAEAGAGVDRLLEQIRSRAQVVVDDRPELEALAEALQKFALDRALAGFSQKEMFATGGGAASTSPREWLAYAREMGRNRALARHPLNPRLFAAAMLAAMPKKT